MQHLHHTLATLALAAACIPATAQDDWQSRKNRENAATSASSITRNGGRFDAQAEAESKQQAQQRAAQQLPVSFTHCDPGFCYDNKGGVYHKVGPDTMTAPNGRMCHKAGNMWNC